MTKYLKIFNLRSKNPIKIFKSSRSTLAAVKKQNEIPITEANYEQAMPYRKIPGPNIIQWVRAFLPGGEFFKLSLIKYHKTIRSKYGTLVKIPGMLGQRETLMSYEPHDFEKIFRNVGNIPIRRGFQTIEYYRKKIRPDIYHGLAGLGPDNGENWYKIRTIVNPILMKPETVRLYIPRVNEISYEFVQKIKTIVDQNGMVPKDFLNLINRWSLESIGYISLDRRLGVLNDETQDERSKAIIELVRKLFEYSYIFEVKPSFWRYVHTPGFKKLLNVYDGLTNLILVYLDEAMKRFQESPTQDEKKMGILEKLLKIDKHVAIVMVIDMLMAGVDTTSTALSGTLYCLAKNPDKQEKLRKEIMSVLPHRDSPLTTENMRNLPYLRACVKEGLRFFPPIVGTMRALPNDLVLQGYRVPNDTDVILCAMSLYYDEKYFKDSDKFIPERWLKYRPQIQGADCPVPHGKPTNNFVYMPFGFGARMCIGRRIAEMEMEVLIMRILREFKVEWQGDDLKLKSVLVNIPDGDLKFKFTPLK